jgi:hypothetical protein
MRIFKFALSFTMHHWGEEIKKREEMQEAHVEKMKNSTQNFNLKT